MATLDLAALAAHYHEAMPDQIRTYLHHRGITDEVIALHHLGWNGHRIAIAIHDRDGKLVFFKLAKAPDDRTNSPKMLVWPRRPMELYGWERVLARPCRIIICEGEFDRLVLESRGIAAVTSTGGAGSFRAEWIADFEPIPEVFLCFDRDAAGKRGAERLARLLPQAKLVALPEDVGPAGDVTDFFVRLGRSKEEFEELLASAGVLPPAPASPVRIPPHWTQPLSDLAGRVAAIKAVVSIVETVRQHVELRPSGGTWRGLCPFHDDHHPSFVVFPKTRSYHCFGCGSHGDVINFIMQFEGIGFRAALELLERNQSEYVGPKRAAA